MTRTKIRKPPEYEEGDAGSVKRLRKSLYGLKQVGQKSYGVLRRILADLGFRVSGHADPGVLFHARVPVEDHDLVLAAHVDYCAMTGSSGELIA
jgi:hypothetical protein